MKKGISLILSVILALGLWGCGAQPAQPTQPATEPATRETVHYGPPSGEGAPTEAATATAAPPEATVEVKDAFADKAVMVAYDVTYYYHIPAIYISGVNTDEINALIYNELYSFIDQYVYQNPDYPSLGDMGYLWTVHDGIVSVIAEVVVAPDGSPNPLYVIYNVDIATGQRISDEALVERFGLDEETYREQVHASLERTFLSFFGQQEGDFYRQQYEKTIADDNVNNVLPYIDVSGELCVAASVYSLAGGDSYRNLIPVTAAIEPAYPRAEPFA